MPLSPGLYVINTLTSFSSSIRNARISVWSNNVTLPEAWENGGCRSPLAKKELKNIEEMSRAENFALHLKYVTSNKNIDEGPSHWLFLVRGSVGPSFKRGLDHRRLTWCLWTATVAEEGIEACCLITGLSRLRILQELMFSGERYRWNITSVFPPFVLVGPLLRYFFDQRQSVSLLPSLSLVYNGIVIGEQYSKLWQ